MATTNIEWTDRVWNPTTGCDQISPGCAHCYAKDIAHRFWKKQYPPVLSEGCALKTRPRRFEDIQVHEDRLEQPLHWKKPARIFVNSMSDLFHEDVPDSFIAAVFGMMAVSGRHTYQVLTKRPERMRRWFEMAGAFTHPAAWVVGRAFEHGLTVVDKRIQKASPTAWPLPNVWLGVSVETQKYADERIPLLLQTPAAVRFISAEPLLGPVDASFYLDPICECETRETLHSGDQHDESCPAGGGKLDWVIVGGESGPQARPFELAWGRSIVQQCQAAAVPVFVKQLGSCLTANYYDTEVRDLWWEREGREWPEPINWDCREGQPPSSSRVRLPLKGKGGGDMASWPADLRVREFPA